MFRLLAILATVVIAFPCTSAQAQGRSGKGRGFKINSGHGIGKMRGHSSSRYAHHGGPGNYRSHYPSPSFGFSIGIGGYPGYGYSGLGYSNFGYSSFGYLDAYRFDGFGYDPYRYGTFRAPDLLDDPYFIQRHRYDSQFPGRYRAPLGVRPTVPTVNYQSHGISILEPANGAAPSVAADPSDPARQLQSAAQQLVRGLSTRQDADVWMVYLAPDKIDQLIATGNVSELRELLSHYDGVVGNPQLRAIATTSGFAATRNLLDQYLSQLAEPTPPLPTDL
jgi:hypothetical protein